jgi:hypothetical protein
MKTKLVVIILSVAGTIICWRGISTLLHYRSFTETTQGVVERRSGNEVIVRFHEERSSPAPQKVEFQSDAEYVFPINERTDKLKVGDKVEAYHPAGRLFDARLDKEFSYLLPAGTVAVGVSLLLAAGATVFVCRKKGTSY